MSGSQALKDVVGPSRKNHPKPQTHPRALVAAWNEEEGLFKDGTVSQVAPPDHTPASLLSPALTELPERRWWRSSSALAGARRFSRAGVEMILKVLNWPMAVTQFDEYHEAVKSCAGRRRVGGGPSVRGRWERGYAVPVRGANDYPVPWWSQ